MLRGLGLTLAAIAYALVFGELFLRLLMPQPLVPRYVTGSPDGVRANIPGVAFRQWTPEVDVIVRYNAAGMRDDRPPPPLAKAPGECRVVLLGDSYFVGFESDFQHSFAYRLEQALKARGKPCRVLDFAVSGFGTAEMLVALKTRALAYHPDLVVMSWHSTDPVDNIRSGLFTLDEQGKLVRLAPIYLPGIDTSDTLMKTPGYRWLIENSHLYSAVRERAGVFFKAQLAKARSATDGTAPPVADDGGDGGTPPAAAPAFGGIPPRRGSLELDTALILGVRDTALAAGARTLLVDVPAWHNRTEFVSMFDWLSADVFDGVATVDPIGALRSAAGPDRPMYLERGQWHWTAAGNAVVAGTVADAIIAKKLLP